MILFTVVTFLSVGLSTFFYQEIGCLSFLILDPYMTKLDFSLLIRAFFTELFDHFVYYFQPYMISLEPHKKLLK